MKTAIDFFYFLTAVFTLTSSVLLLGILVFFILALFIPIGEDDNGDWS